MSFIAAKLRGGLTPRIRELPVAAAQSFLKGALLVRDANGAWAECAADPTAVGGVALSDYGADTAGYGGHGTKEFPPGFMQGASVTDEQPFHARYIGTLPAADGGSYGTVKDSDGLWKVDFGETTTVSVKLIGRMTNSPENRNRVIVAFLAAAVQVVV